MDAIAAAGVHFTSGYVSASICGPSRAGLMTGRYQQRFGWLDNPPSGSEYFLNGTVGLSLAELTIAEALAPAGYRSMACGKWHLGGHSNSHPLNRGFDHFYGFSAGGHHYLPELANDFAIFNR
jgi:arylsulfatase A-like enzyme